MEVKLVMFMADGKRKEFAVHGPASLIGRGGDCHIQIPLATVSRHHCQINKSKDELSVRDVGSSNGTFVNENRVTESPLKAGDKLVVGPVIFIVTVAGKPEKIKPVLTVIPENTVEPVNQSDGSGTIDVPGDSEKEVETSIPLDDE